MVRKLINLREEDKSKSKISTRREEENEMNKQCEVSKKSSENEICKELVTAQLKRSRPGTRVVSNKKKDIYFCREEEL